MNSQQNKKTKQHTKYKTLTYLAIYLKMSEY